MVLLSGSGLATILSLAYNIVIGWFLGPKSFGHATVVYSLLVLLSAISFAFQIVAAKMVAQQPSAETKAEVYRCFHRSAIGCGISVALVLFLFRQGIADYLNLPDSSLIAMLAIAAGFYIPLGARRGYDQGSYRFHRLAMSLVIEGAVRLGGSYALVVDGLRRARSCRGKCCGDGCLLFCDDPTVAGAGAKSASLLGRHS